MNKKIAEKIAGYLTEENEEVTYVKIVYYLETLLGELEKSIIIILLFSCIGYFTYIAIIMCMLYILRPFLGGTHCSTYFSCLLYSIGICTLPLVLHQVIKMVFHDSGNIENWMLEIIVSICMLVFIILIAPVKSKYRPTYKGKILFHMKLKGIAALLLSNVVYIFLETLQPYITWMLCILLLDGIMAYTSHLRNIKVEA